MPEVVLYTKADCSLCTDAKQMLARLSGRYPHQLVEIDITQDDTLFDRYRYRIPVLVIAGRELAAPIDPQKLEEALIAGRLPEQ
jgi:glutaredoxin